MTFVAEPQTPPIYEDSSGALRVGKSRVLLELVIDAFDNGATPEAIVQGYDTLSLQDVYAIIAYYLRQPDQIRSYLRQREQQAATVRQQIEGHSNDLAQVRQRLQVARRAQGVE